MTNEKKRVHFVGIGGCSMNGLAQIMASRGYTVQGSDKAASPFTERLSELGIPVTIGHNAQNVDGCDLVIYSAAIKPDNPERVRAAELGIEQIERSVALGRISEGYGAVVGIAGCHGKTTITSMLALIAEHGGLDATVHVGGFVEFLHGGTRIGSQDLFITEACEYVESFLTLRPTVALINNIDDDHLDYFKDIDAITDAFRKFVRLIPQGGMLIGNTDDPRVRSLADEFRGTGLAIVTYGLDDSLHPDFHIADERYDELGCPSFTVFRGEERLGDVTLHVPGRHNMLNALAAIAVAVSHRSDFATAAGALEHFANTRRRFEFYFERRGVRVFHDYAHHPAEIRAAMDSALRTPHKKLFVVFQCNSYTRARTLFTRDVDCFRGADMVLVPDIFPGRERDDGTVHAGDMADAINRETENALYIPNFEGISDWLIQNAGEGDIVLTLGSGDVYIQTNKLLA